MPTKIKHLQQWLIIKWWTWRFKRHCKTYGEQLRIEGPCIINAEGTLTAGDKITIRSRNHLPVEFYVASGAKLTLKNNIFINQGVRFSCSNQITIGSGCIIGDELFY